ncbi:hypothetical protein Syun_004773 [Stephania yunnanensis]|uniref:Uncharacterized protein n=1 Tax=Stephania yunnanensis TaxID=152371 RepID=A0AAP0Q5A2_9MAGN
MAATARAGDHGDLVEQKKDTEEEVVELMKKLELGHVPDDEIRRLIKVQLDRRIRLGYQRTYEQQTADVLNFAHSLRGMRNIATEVDTLDAKLYEVPTPFLKLICCYFKDDSTTLDEAEVAMLDLYCERSQIKDGQRVLDLGCGQGALTMHIAQKYKNCHDKNLTNVDTILADMTTHETQDKYDRILAIAVIEDDVTIVNNWTVNGKHWARTNELWLKNIDDNAEAVKKIMLSCIGSEEAAVKQFNFWRRLNLLGMELFGYGNGDEWMTSHVLSKKKP